MSTNKPAFMRKKIDQTSHSKNALVNKNGKYEQLFIIFRCEKKNKTENENFVETYRLYRRPSTMHYFFTPKYYLH